MSFLSKNGAGILACLLISIVSWFLGGFFPVVGAPVFAIFAGMLLHPWLSPYKQLDAGLTFSSKKLLHPFHHFDFLNRCLPLPAFLCARHKTGYLDWSGFFYLWWFCHCCDSTRYPCQGKRSCPSHLRYLFLQCLSSTYLSNSRNLASPIQ